MLTYIGDGAALYDVPARDLTEADLIDLAERLGFSAAALQEDLLNSGLYQASESPALGGADKKAKSKG